MHYPQYINPVRTLVDHVENAVVTNAEPVVWVAIMRCCQEGVSNQRIHLSIEARVASDLRRLFTRPKAVG